MTRHEAHYRLFNTGKAADSITRNPSKIARALFAADAWGQLNSVKP